MFGRLNEVIDPNYCNNRDADVPFAGSMKVLPVGRLTAVMGFNFSTMARESRYAACICVHVTKEHRNGLAYCHSWSIVKRMFASYDCGACTKCHIFDTRITDPLRDITVVKK